MGALIEELRSTQRQTTENIERLESLLASGNYPDLKTDYSSAAQVYLVGTVPNKSTRQKLLEQVVSTFGTQEAEMMIRYVEVNTASP